MENTEKGKNDDGANRPEIMMNETQPDKRHADSRRGQGTGEARKLGADQEAGQYGDDEEQGHKPDEQVTSPKEFTKKEDQAGQDKSAAV